MPQGWLVQLFVNIRRQSSVSGRPRRIELIEKYIFVSMAWAYRVNPPVAKFVRAENHRYAGNGPPPTPPHVLLAQAQAPTAHCASWPILERENVTGKNLRGKLSEMECLFFLFWCSKMPVVSPCDWM
jgi:hypothetical protein